MTKKLLNLGTVPNDQAGDSLRSAGAKINDNFNEIYTAIGDGSVSTLALIAKSGSYNDLIDKPFVEPPSSSDSTGVVGQLAFDSNYFYVCVGENLWKRTQLTTW